MFGVTAFSSLNSIFRRTLYWLCIPYFSSEVHGQFNENGEGTLSDAYLNSMSSICHFHILSTGSAITRRTKTTIHKTGK